jgi:hypothetical protein
MADTAAVDGPPTDPVPVTTDRARRADRSARGTRQPARRPSPRPAPARRSVRLLERRYRQTIRRVDLWSVLKLSICFYLAALIVALGAGMVLWWIASQLGVIDGVEDFMGELLSSDDFQFLSWRILRGATLIGLVVVCLMVVLTVLAAAFYNVFSEIVGGVEITVSEEEAPRE